MRISVVNTTDSNISKSLLRQVLIAAAKETQTYDAQHSVVVSFLADKEVRRLNAKYRKIDRVTDVLSFTYTSDTQSPVLDQAAKGEQAFGELVIAPAQMARQAKRRNHSHTQELRDLLIHGYLHLLGHDHHKAGERKRMRAWEDRIRRRVKTQVRI